ncbi:MAG: GNAT family N-acetyltransferase [Roseburia sp.]|nr:GNAT family N-acetyltransferase [Roseburia sp.]
MSNVYETCPTLENENYRLRLVAESDAEDLRKVYGDKFALPFFNSDNCHGDNFYYPTAEGMREAIRYWLMEYENRGFVRFAIVEKDSDTAIGTIELFHRVSEDFFHDCGILRLDVGSKYECEEVLCEILSVIIEPAYGLFECKMIATKAPIYAVERITALKKMGFEKSAQKVVGHDGTVYGDYWCICAG